MNNAYGIDRNNQNYRFRNNGGIAVRGGYCEACISNRDLIDALRYSTPIIDEEVVNRFNYIYLDSTSNFPIMALCEDIPDMPTLWSKEAPICLYDEWCEEQDDHNTYSESLDDFLNEFALKEDDMNR